MACWTGADTMKVYVGYVKLLGRKPHWAYQLACAIKHWEQEGFLVQKIICDVNICALTAFVSMVKISSAEERRHKMIGRLMKGTSWEAK